MDFEVLQLIKQHRDGIKDDPAGTAERHAEEGLSGACLQMACGCQYPLGVLQRWLWRQGAADGWDEQKCSIILSLTCNHGHARRPATLTMPKSEQNMLNTPARTGANVLNVNSARSNGDSARHVNTESLGSVKGSTGFKATRYAVNPGIASMFPWLSKIAANYQKYKFNSLSFEFRTTVGEFAAAGQQGRTVLSFNYDPIEPLLATLAQAENMCPKTLGMSDSTSVLILDPKVLTPTSRFIRGDVVPSGGTSLVYDSGTLFFSTAGMVNATDDIGELYVTYDVTLTQPMVAPLNYASPPLSTQILCQYIDSSYSVPANALTAFSQYGMGQINGLGATIVGSGFTLPGGNYIISFRGTFQNSAGTITRLRVYRAGGVPTLGDYAWYAGTGTINTITFNCEWVISAPTVNAIVVAPSFICDFTSGITTAVCDPQFSITAA